VGYDILERACMKKFTLILIMFIFSVSVYALPLVSLKDQIREELWHEGITQEPKPQTQNKTKPILNEEVLRALVKYQL